MTNTNDSAPHISSESEYDEIMFNIKRDGSLLKDIPAVLKEDRGIVMAAVSESGEALEHAAEELKRDQEIVLAAMNHNGSALESGKTAKP